MGITTAVSTTSAFPKVEGEGKGHSGYSCMSTFNLKKSFMLCGC